MVEVNKADSIPVAAAVIGPFEEFSDLLLDVLGYEQGTFCSASGAAALSHTVPSGA